MRYGSSGCRSGVYMCSVDRSWNDLLDPDVLRPRLTRVSLFIVGFEMLKDTIVERPKRFFQFGDRNSPNPVWTEIVSRNKSLVHACLDWLCENKAIDDEDIKSFERAKDCRNHLAHRMLEVLAESGLPVKFDETFSQLVALLHKIEVWWIIEFDVPADPTWDGREIDAAEVLPGPIAGLQLLHDVLLGSPEQSRYYLDAFRARFGPG
jgi:hypothetical protein